MIRKTIIKYTLMLVALWAAVVVYVVPSYASHYSPKTIKLKITVTNITKSIVLTPPLLAIASEPMRLFALGQSAGIELAKLAEGGNRVPLANQLIDKGARIIKMEGPIEPASSKSVIVTVPLGSYLHMASMLLPTNDAFVGLNGLSLRSLVSRSRTLKAYDAGTESNDELCVSIPGPQCGGEGFSPEDGEGIVHPHPGVHGEADLSRSAFAWGNPVVMISARIMN